MGRLFHFVFLFAWLLGLGAVKAELTEAQAQTLKLQIYLNNHNFGPGFLDAKAGKFTQLAAQHYNLKHGRDKTDFRYARESQEAIDDPIAMSVVPSFASKFVDPNLPTEKKAQSLRQDMPYRSFAEFMAERYHTSVSFLAEINGWAKMRNLKPRSSLLVPNVDPFLIENLRQGKMHHQDPSLINRYVIIDTTSHQLKIYQKAFFKKAPAPIHPFLNRPVESVSDMIAFEKFEAGSDTPPKMIPAILPDQLLFQKLKETDLIATFPITPGKPQFIRKGYWKIEKSIELPIWRYDKSLLETGVRGSQSLVIPAGPNNPVGVMWHGLSKKGIGIHGTSSPETIGRSQSAGCIRLSNWNVVKLPSLIRPGTKVWLK